jgi:hypothetical protein
MAANLPFFSDAPDIRYGRPRASVLYANCKLNAKKIQARDPKQCGGKYKNSDYTARDPKQCGGK